jgi:diguanylate cyclase (GGDEF)-like protein
MEASSTLLTCPQILSLLRIEFARARRYSFPLSCLAVAIDGARSREAPLRDELLRSLADKARGQLRGSDAIGRWEERLVLVLPHTAADGARAIAERLRGAAARLERVREAGAAPLTLSVGAATFHERGAIFFDSVLKSAEAALAEAQAEGGDRIETGPPAPVAPAP